MRIIAGIRRGHTIQGPSGSQATRPTSDMVREAIFDILGPAVEDCPVVDLFAGTGALGLEALSRGASFVTFVERRRENVALIHRNLSALRFEGCGEIIVADAYKWVHQFEPTRPDPMIVFLDPPYRDYERAPNRIRSLLATLEERLPAGSVLVVESGRELGPDVLSDLKTWDQRRYGTTHVGFHTVEDRLGAHICKLS